MAADAPRAGEVRLEGTVRRADATHQTLVLLVTRAQDPGKAAQNLNPPRSKDVVVRSSTVLRPAAGAKAALSAFEPGDAVTIIGKNQGPGRPLVARMISAAGAMVEQAPPAAFPPAKSGAEALQKFLAARGAGRYSEAYALLSPDTQKMLPFQRFATAAELPKDPHADGMTPPLMALAAMFIDVHDTLGYRYQVLGPSPTDPNVLLVNAVPPGASPLPIQVATVPVGGGVRLDAMRSLTLTDPHALEAARNAAQQTSSLSNIKQIGLAIMQYAQDHNSTLPDADKWVDEIMPYLQSEAVFHDPSTPNVQKWSYAYNKALSHKDISSIRRPSATVMVFESTLGAKNASDDGTSVPHPGWHRGGTDYGFVDGHAKWLADNEKPAFNL